MGMHGPLILQPWESRSILGKTNKAIYMQVSSHNAGGNRPEEVSTTAAAIWLGFPLLNMAAPLHVFQLPNVSCPKCLISLWITQVHKMLPRSRLREGAAAQS